MLPFPVLNANQCETCFEEDDDLITSEKPNPIKWHYHANWDSVTCGTVSVTPAGLMVNGARTNDTPPFAQLKLGRVIGRGRFCTVLKTIWAGDPQHKVMALKRYDSSDNDRKDARHGVEYEIEMLLHPVSHPNLVGHFNMFCSRGIIYVLTEYTNRGNLQTLIQHYGPLPSDLNVSISRQVLYGLQALHNAGFVHRNLKPSDILFNSNGSVKISNFGIAKHCDDDEVEYPNFMMRLRWENASPEQIRRKPLDAKVDSYLFGLLMGYCACGFYPLLSRSDVAAQIESFLNQHHFGIIQGQGIVFRAYQLVRRINRLQTPAATFDLPFLKLVRARAYADFAPIDCPAPMQDLIQSCLCDSPAQRPSCEELLQHPLFCDPQLKTEEEHRSEARTKVLAWFETIGHPENRDFVGPPQDDVLASLLLSIRNVPEDPTFR